MRHLTRVGALLLAGFSVSLVGSPSQASTLTDQYVVELDLSARSLVAPLNLDRTIEQLVTQLGGGQIVHRYRHVFPGFSIRLPRHLVPLLQQLPGVKRVEPDQLMRATGVQTNPAWHLDRIDQPTLPLNGLFNYPDTAGVGTHVYIVDTGLRASHKEFIGRVGAGRNFERGSGLFSAVDPANTRDCNGHGTHVAGNAVGSTWGVAKRATLYPVRVLGCQGTGANSSVIAGIDWIVANHRKPAIANLSLGGGNSEALDQAVRTAVSRGITFVVAAGNDNINACTGSPNRVPEAVTVAATDRTDQRASFSNHGRCVDLFAPGAGVISASIASDTAAATLSGTSMAAPQVAGAAALILSALPDATPAQVAERLVQESVSNVVINPTEAPNRLLQVTSLRAASGTAPAMPPAPAPAPLPEPTPAPVAPCTNCTAYSLTVRSGSTILAPNSGGFSVTGGTVQGFLRLPTTVRAELSLERLQRSLFSSRWVTVARSDGARSDPALTLAVSSGTYRWRIQGVSGSGEGMFFGQPR